MIETAKQGEGRWTARRLVWATLVVCSVALAFYLFYRYYIVAFVVFVGIVVGTAIRPAVAWLGRRGIPTALGVIIVYVALVGLLIGGARLVFPLLSDQVSTIAAHGPEYYQGFRSALVESRSRLLHQLAAQLPLQLPTSVPAPSPSAAAQASPPDPVAELAHLLDGLVTALFVTTSILVLALYWTLDGERTIRGLLLRLQQDRREAAREIISEMETKVSAYLVGQSIVCLSVGLMALVAYLIIGLPYALVLAVLAAVLEAVPVIGPILGAAPAVLLALSLAPDKVIWVVVAVIVIQQAENNILVPRVMDRSVGVNPIVTILAIAAFATLFGLPGAVLAIPMAAVLQILLDRFVLGPEAAERDQPEGRDRLSTLRWEAQELVRDVRKQMRRPTDAATDEGDGIEDLIESIATDLDSVLAQRGQPSSQRARNGLGRAR